MTVIPDEGPVRYQMVEFAARELFRWNDDYPMSPRFVIRSVDDDYADIVQVVLDAIEQYAGEK